MRPRREHDPDCLAGRRDDRLREAAEDVDVTVPMTAGANRIVLSWPTDKYDSIVLDRVEVSKP